MDGDPRVGVGFDRCLGLGGEWGVRVGDDTQKEGKVIERGRKEYPLCMEEVLVPVPLVLLFCWLIEATDVSLLRPLGSLRRLATEEAQVEAKFEKKNDLIALNPTIPLLPLEAFDLIWEIYAGYNYTEVKLNLCLS